MKAIAFCGLACCVCSENKGCVGCQDGGCESHGWCKNYNCCKEKGLNGRWECSEFPFTGCMLDKPRIRAFAEFARRYRVRTVILHLFLTGIPRFNTIGTQKHWRFATRLTGDYLDQTFTGKLITACRTHDFHPLETCAARCTIKNATEISQLHFVISFKH